MEEVVDGLTVVLVVEVLDVEVLDVVAVDDVLDVELGVEVLDDAVVVEVVPDGSAVHTSISVRPTVVVDGRSAVMWKRRPVTDRGENQTVVGEPSLLSVPMFMDVPSEKVRSPAVMLSLSDDRS